MEISMSEKENKPVKTSKKRSNFGKKFVLSTILFAFTLLVSSIATYIVLGGTGLVNVNFILPYSKITFTVPQGIPEDVAKKIAENLTSVKLDNQSRFEQSEDGDVKFVWSEGSGVFNEYIVPVSHFYNVNDDFNPNKQKVYIDSKIGSEIKTLLKVKYPKAVETDDVAKVLDENGKNVALIKAEDLTFKVKLLTLNGKYFLDNFDGGLKFGISVQAKKEVEKTIAQKNLVSLASFEFSKDNIGKINQTGVTAITRALASKIESVGDYGYPAKAVSSFLKDADFTHVSNEISSAAGCVPSDGMRFCAKPEYLKSLKDSGVDIVELTGNHNNDYGAANNTSTINSYKKLGWLYFGGGLDATDAAKILYVESKGTKIAFIGYNYYDTMQGTGAIATKDHAGANSYSVKKLKANIAEARKNAQIVIVDFQFQECYSYPESAGPYPICYKPLDNPDQRTVFKQAIDVGADIVVGTQAHQPQTYEIYKDKVIFYGLGNLFFDQAYWLGTKHGMILTHYYKDGKHIQTKITTTNYDIRLQTYISKGSERLLLLNLLKEARD